MSDRKYTALRGIGRGRGRGRGCGRGGGRGNIPFKPYGMWKCTSCGSTNKDSISCGRCNQPYTLCDYTSLVPINLSHAKHSTRNTTIKCCSQCTYSNAIAADKCIMCDFTFSTPNKAITSSSNSCVSCTFVNSNNAIKCAMCNTLLINSGSIVSSIPQPKHVITWNCPACTYSNSISKNNCEICNQRKP